MAATLRKRSPEGALAAWQRLLLAAVLVALGSLPCTVEATCPNNLALRLRLCVMTSGILDALERTGSDVGVAMEFCQSGVRAGVDCLTSYMAACGHTPDGNATLTLLVDMDRIRENLEVFCSSLLTLQREATCLRLNASDCVSRVIGDFTTHDTSHMGGKGIMDLTCTFFDDVELCLTFEAQDLCFEPASILQRLVKAFRFDYCDLEEDEKIPAAGKYFHMDMLYVPVHETTTTADVRVTGPSLASTQLGHGQRLACVLAVLTMCVGIAMT